MNLATVWRSDKCGNCVCLDCGQKADCLSGCPNCVTQGQAPLADCPYDEDDADESRYCDICDRHCDLDDPLWVCVRAQDEGGEPE